MAVLQQRLRGLTLALCVASCGAPAEPDGEAGIARRYLTDPGFRRATLVGSLLAPATPYGVLRLRRYESGDALDWSGLPVWNPMSTSLTSEPPAPLSVPEAARLGDLDALRALGERAFFGYPAQLAPAALERAADAPDELARYGVPRETLRRVTLPAGGGTAVAMTCATCHTSRDPSGAVRVGAANAALALGALLARDLDDPTRAARLRAWGAGRVDVSTEDGREPVAMPDLRAVRFQRNLHRAGAVAQRDLASLAVRIETLLITSLHAAVRPPREVSLGLAVYLRALGDALPPARGEPAGYAVFASRCARCHAPDDLSGGNVPADEVGTDRAIADSVERGTGAYRVPSLRGVGTRGPLLHDGAAPDLDALLDSARLRADYAGSRRGPGPIAGHAYGLDLGTDDRAALLRHLRAL